MGESREIKKWLDLDQGSEEEISLERHLEHCCQWVDDLIDEHNKFQYYLRNVERSKDSVRWQFKRRGDAIDDEDATSPWKHTALPPRLDSLLVANQIKQYCAEIMSHTTCRLSNLQFEAVFHKQE